MLVQSNNFNFYPHNSAPFNLDPLVPKSFLRHVGTFLVIGHRRKLRDADKRRCSPQHLVDGLLNYRRRECRLFWQDFAFQDPLRKRTNPPEGILHLKKGFLNRMPDSLFWPHMRPGADFRHNFPQSSSLGPSKDRRPRTTEQGPRTEDQGPKTKDQGPRTQDPRT